MVESQDFTKEDYYNALLESRSALNSLAFCAPEMMGLHLDRIAGALLDVGIEPHG
jgi:hypothetical protein